MTNICTVWEIRNDVPNHFYVWREGTPTLDTVTLTYDRHGLRVQSKNLYIDLKIRNVPRGAQIERDVITMLTILNADYLVVHTRRDEASGIPDFDSTRNGQFTIYEDPAAGKAEGSLDTGDPWLTRSVAHPAQAMLQTWDAHCLEATTLRDSSNSPSPSPPSTPSSTEPDENYMPRPQSSRGTPWPRMPQENTSKCRYRSDDLKPGKGVKRKRALDNRRRQSL